MKILWLSTAELPRTARNTQPALLCSGTVLNSNPAPSSGEEQSMQSFLDTLELSLQLWRTQRNIRERHLIWDLTQHHLSHTFLSMLRAYAQAFTEPLFFWQSEGHNIKDTQWKPSSSVFPEVSPVHTHHLTEEFVLNWLHVFSDRAHLKTARTAAGFLGVVIKNMTQSGHTGGE